MLNVVNQAPKSPGNSTKTPSDLDATLHLTEIFYSIQGESRFSGQPCAFIRLTGCNLRCTWCDTPYSFHGGEPHSVKEIMQTIARYPVKRVEITGGEPLLQKNVYALMRILLSHGYETLLETSGSLSIAEVPTEICRVVDVKCPASQESHTFCEENWSLLTPHDEIKFVIQDRNDFEFAARIVQERLPPGILYSFSPVHDALAAQTLAEWILESGLDARLNIQLHKYLWGNAIGR